ncbi:ribonuclease III [Paremcibacter congregatus]|uniref:Ribonuclease 3 n=1 Tax=Paremcibacter congregatus TaxID=2043170 RepID=A0A2G4YN96_9PROT|nr:ribonuclease III [Paremcibacter congregatus]PHZ83804.1 ribonuclease III [Paremcibacter congregatus]QDE27507.1 ribonuclease III [Paremcibacter congregatus]
MSSHQKPRKTGQYGRLYDILEYEFTNDALLREALTHPSLEGGKHYQRLEFVGDRVLGLVIAEWLHDYYPSLDEGGLASRHTNMVRKEALAEVARDMKLPDFIHMAKSAEDNGGLKKSSILADVCEAVIGAVNQDGGYLNAQKLVRKFWTRYIDQDAIAQRDAKTRLQEWVQGRQMQTPKYVMTDRTGPAHAPFFTIEVRVKDWEPEVGKGTSKREAEQDAAAKLLRRLES